MPPRRPPRRGRSQGLSGIPALPEVALKDLRRAHTLMERGEHANAAVLFERQAREAGDRGLSLSAAHLHLQAGRARLLAGESEAGAVNLRQGLEILAQGGDPERLAKSGGLLIKDLLHLGQDQLVKEVTEFLEHELAKHPGVRADADPSPANLPLKCSKCAAVRRAEDTEKLKNGLAVCVYCGHLVGHRRNRDSR